MVDHVAIEKARAKYDVLVSDLGAVEAVHGLYLTDENIDHENSEHEAEGSLEYWEAMHRSASSAAGARAEDYGLNINKLLGYVIY
jgi:hypothetical protein